MAGSRTFEIKGLEAFEAALLAVGRDATKAKAKAMIVGGNIFRKRARELVPVHVGAYPPGHYKKPRKPGTLKKSITVKVIGYKWATDIDQVRGWLIVRDPVGHLLEFGHKTRAGKKLHRNIFSYARKPRFKPNAKRFVSARQYMRPALEQRAEAAMRGMIGKLQSSITANKGAE